MDTLVIFYFLLALAIGAIAAIALVISLVIYNRTRKKLEQLGRESEVGKEMMLVYLQAAKFEAATNLLAEKITFQTTKNFDVLGRNTSKIYQLLELAYRDKDMAGKEEWREIRQDFESVNAKIKSMSADTLSALEILIDTLHKEAKVK